MTDTDKAAILDAVLFILRSSDNANVKIERSDFSFSASFVPHDEFGIG